MSAIRLRGVSVEFPIYQGGSRSLKKTLMRVGAGGTLVQDARQRVMVEALHDIDLDLGEGDRLGLIGPNGAGKTTLLRVLAGTYEPARGELSVVGDVAPLFDVGLGLNPDATGVENIMFRGLYMGLSPAMVRQHVAEIVEFTELGDYIHMPLRTYSAGMMLRLAFSIATCTIPDILLLDEWVLAGDARFLEKARQRLASFVNRSSIMVLASHDSRLIREWCNKALFLEKGRIRAFGAADAVVGAYEEAIGLAVKD